MSLLGLLIGLFLTTASLVKMAEAIERVQETVYIRWRFRSAQVPYFPDYKSHLNISRTPYFCLKFGENSWISRTGVLVAPSSVI